MAHRTGTWCSVDFPLFLHVSDVEVCTEMHAFPQNLRSVNKWMRYMGVRSIRANIWQTYLQRETPRRTHCSHISFIHSFGRLLIQLTTRIACSLTLKYTKSSTNIATHGINFGLPLTRHKRTFLNKQSRVGTSICVWNSHSWSFWNLFLAFSGAKYLWKCEYVWV